MRKKIYSTKKQDTQYFANMCTIDGTEEIYKGFNDWLLEKYGVTSDDMTDDDYDMYYDEYRADAITSCFNSEEEALVNATQDISEDDSEDAEPVEAFTTYEDWLEPPEQEEPEDMSEFQEVIEVYIDADIVMEDNGMGWEYEDDNWARNPKDPKGSYYSEEVRNLQINDYVGIIEDIDVLLQEVLPAQTGTFHIKGLAHLVYNISGVQYTVDRDGEPTYYEDSSTIRFDVANSYIDDFTIDKVQ